MSVGGGYNSSSGSSKTKSVNYPKWAEDYFQNFEPKGQTALDNYDPTGGPLRAAATTELNRNVTGYYTDPANDPTLQPIVAGIERGGQEAFDRFSNQISSGAQRTGGLFSTSALKQKEEAARRVSGDISSQIANLYGNFRNAERTRQVGAVAPATNMSLLDLNQALAIANLFKNAAGKNKGATDSSGWNVNGSVSYT